MDVFKQESALKKLSGNGLWWRLKVNLPASKKTLRRLETLEAENSSQEVENWIRAGAEGVKRGRWMGSEINKVSKQMNVGNKREEKWKILQDFNPEWLEKMVVVLLEMIIELRKELGWKKI